MVLTGFAKMDIRKTVNKNTDVMIVIGIRKIQANLPVSSSINTK